MVDLGGRRRAFIRELNTDTELPEETTIDISMESLLRFHGEVVLNKSLSNNGRDSQEADVNRKRPNYDNRRRRLFAQDLDKTS